MIRPAAFVNEVDGLFFTKYKYAYTECRPGPESDAFAVCTAKNYFLADEPKKPL